MSDPRLVQVQPFVVMVSLTENGANMKVKVPNSEDDVVTPPVGSAESALLEGGQ